jgi:4-carboxymuconolactone decarboxylase
MAKAGKSGARLKRGKKRLREIHGRGGEAVVEALAAIAPDLARYIVEFAFGDVYSRGGLSLKERQIATVAALVALGHPQPQLKSHIHGALNVGCSRKEVIEIIIQMAIYAGFPAALNAATSAQEVFRDRDGKGIRD